ncbi:helix-turn-helix domain-containing protein [Halanaerobacter jeridensis]|uniref:Excisionase family DNA binding protein n=1 Tax=Halanaerobacter jeridensis TaxID=706427 RepID=A0A938XWC3_9FIRM|nr:helix-turn-helix domain-containing protein [Halanaerobacter jeridensis]MBM7556832.1 excisionase family DNA binding protein [Halanaerobacter jeridensis]
MANQSTVFNELLTEIKKLNNTLAQNNNDNSKSEVEFLNVKEAADLLNLSTSNIYDKINQGKIPACEIGGRKVINKEKLIEHISSQTH